VTLPGKARGPRHPLVRALLGLLAAVLVVIGWFVATVAYPRMADPEAIPALMRPISFASGVDARSVATTLDGLADTFLSREDSAGIAIGVIVDGRRQTIARGVSSKTATLRPLDEDSLFEIASVTKVFTGIALAQALLRGDLALEQPIESLLPEAYASPQLTAREITVADLATHHAGVQRAPSAIPGWSPMFPGNPWKELTEADMLASLNKALEDPPVAEGYSYSGFGYMLLGRALEQASGRPYGALIEDGIAAPLGMSNTWVTLTDESRARLVDGHVNGHTIEHHLDHAFPAAGGIASSLNDLLTPRSQPAAGANAHRRGPAPRHAGPAPGKR
jgi:CubicO group peptidase (beta-lactamase class C family)